MKNKILLTVLVSLIAVCAFSGVGYAFTAMTYNLDNNAQVEYTVLAQDTFTFNDDGKLRYYSYVDNSTGGVLYYMLNGGHDNSGSEIPLIKLGKKVNGEYYKHNSKYYWGAMIGSSELTINLVNNDSDYAIISIPMGNFEYNKNIWRYFLKVSHDDGHGGVDYVEWLWSKGNGWNNFDVPEGLTQDEKEKIHVPVNGASSYTVDVELYFAGPEYTLPNSGGRIVAGAVGTMPAFNNTTYKLMDDAWIRYVYDSDATITIKNGNSNVIYDRNGVVNN